MSAFHKRNLPIALTTARHPVLLYYDYLLTFGRERRLFWSWHHLKRWGSIMFFLNRYLGVVGHVPVFIYIFARPGSTLYLVCDPVHLYHQCLAVIVQTFVACMFSKHVARSWMFSLPLNSYFHHENLCIVQ